MYKRKINEVNSFIANIQMVIKYLLVVLLTLKDFQS